MGPKEDSLYNLFGEYAEVNEQQEKSTPAQSIFDGIFAGVSALEAIQMEREKIGFERKKLRNKEKELRKKEAELAKREAQLQEQQAQQATIAAEAGGLNFSSPEQVRNAFIASEIFNRRY